MRDLDHIVLRYHLTAAIAERFWSKVDKSGGPDACWPWTASCRGNGYGRFKIEPRVSVATNRLAWALHNQKDPGPMLVCSCSNALRQLGAGISNSLASDGENIGIG